MMNEKLKDCLDDALSGIRENPWLYQQVLHRAERNEQIQMKKKRDRPLNIKISLFLKLEEKGNIIKHVTPPLYLSLCIM